MEPGTEEIHPTRNEEGQKSELGSVKSEALASEERASLDTANLWEIMTVAEKAEFEKKLIRKLDYRLIPWPMLLYLASFLDRTNIGNAKIQGVSSLGYDETYIYLDGE